MNKPSKPISYAVFGAALLVSASQAVGMTTLISPTLNGGGFEISSSANAASTSEWTFQFGTGTYGQGLTATGFVALGRTNAPSAGLHGGSLGGVINSGTRGVFDSNAIAATIVSGDVFDFSGFFSTNTLGSSAPGSYSLELRFSDATTGLLTSESVLTGANTGRIVGSPTPQQSGAPVGDTDWLEVNHSFTYTGAGASSVVLRVQMTQNGGPQAYFDDFTLTHTPIPEPSVALLGGLGFLGLMRRRR